MAGLSGAQSPDRLPFARAACRLLAPLCVRAHPPGRGQRSFSKLELWEAKMEIRYDLKDKLETATIVIAYACLAVLFFGPVIH